MASNIKSLSSLILIALSYSIPLIVFALKSFVQTPIFTLFPIRKNLMASSLLYVYNLFVPNSSLMTAPSFTIAAPHETISAFVSIAFLYKTLSISLSIRSSASIKIKYSPCACLIPLFLAALTPEFS